MAVYNPMKGRDSYLEYLSGKFETFKKDGIVYNPETKVLSDGKVCIILYSSHDATDNPATIQFAISNNKIQSMLMRPYSMFSLNDLNDNQKFDIIVGNVCQIIHNWVEAEVTRLGFTEKDFNWIQFYPYFDAPAFQHMCFRLGKSVFSLNIKLLGQFHTPEDGYMVSLPNVQPENQERECSNNDLIACDIMIDVNSLTTPTLCYANKDELVDLRKEAESGSGIMSEWEINATALNIVLNHIQGEDIEWLSYTNVLTFYPQIFYRKEGQKYFIYVEGHPAGINAKPLNVSQVERASMNGCHGQFANVEMCILDGNNGEFKDIVLYRCNSIVSNFKTLMPIDKAEQLYGTYNGGVFPVN